MKTYKTSRIIANKISSIFQKNKISFKDSNELFTGKLAVKKFDADLSSNSFTIVSLTHYEMCLIHQYLRLQSKKSGDYRKNVYLPEDYRVNAIIGTLTKKTLNHIGQQYIKDLENLTMLNFENFSKEERMFITSYEGSLPFSKLPSNFVNNTNLLSYLQGKRVLVISNYSELIKIQHLNQKKLHPKINKNSSFEVLTINPDLLFHEKEAFTLFEKLDALKVEILKYYFDVALINLSVLNLPVASFISTLHRNSLALGNEIYQIFGIAKDSAEKSKHDDHWVDLSSYRSGNEDTFLATGIIGSPIKTKRTRRHKHVH